MKQLYLQNLRSPGQAGKKKLDTPNVRRYELPLEELSGADQERPLPKGEDMQDYTSLYEGMELPRINYDEHNGKPYRCVGVFTFESSLCKAEVHKLEVSIFCNGVCSINLRSYQFLKRP